MSETNRWRKLLAALLSLHVFSSSFRGKVDRRANRLMKNFKERPGFQGGTSSSSSPLSQGRTLILGCISPRSPGVSWSNEIFSREGWGAPVSRGIDCSDAAPTDTLPPNAILPSSPLLYLTAVGIKRENDWWRDGVNVAEPPSDRRHAHSADKVEPPAHRGRGCLVTQMEITHKASMQVHCKKKNLI